MKKYNSLLSFNLKCAAGPARESYARKQPGFCLKQNSSIITSHIERFDIHQAEISGNQTKENNHKGVRIGRCIRREDY